MTAFDALDYVWGKAVTRPLLEKTAVELDAMVERNRDNGAELKLVLAELAHRKTVNAKQVAAKARRYLDKIPVAQKPKPAKSARASVPGARSRLSIIKGLMERHWDDLDHLKMCLNEMEKLAGPEASDLRRPLRERIATLADASPELSMSASKAAEKKDQQLRDDPKAQQRREWTHQAIAGLRAKLIDLSKRNPLISFKHSERGATYLRVVDERPDHLFETLIAGDMRFEPLPDEDDTPRDELTDDFRIAYERARLTDPAYLKAIEGLGEEAADAAAIQQAERALRASVRQLLGLPRVHLGKGIDIAALAKANGFDPSFELSDTDDAADDEHHRDDRIRVLLTEKQLDRRLRTIYDRYRGHEAETGLHTLFLALGFAEWFEDDASDLALHAPALLLPVHLERKLTGGKYHFRLSARDEDLQVNVAMRELLKQRFGLEAPALREEETPESYFIRLAGVLATVKRFNLRRYATLAVLPFPRMVLWQDLDAANWPEGAFENHILLPKLLGADSSGGAPGFGADYAIDDPTFGKTVPPIVTDADVSQHSVLIDVAAGIPLAIEGPPGTGKSQTITNIIAGALDVGKRVLFVAEKQAALGVVAERLRALGFGPLLLELHSDRANKLALLKSVDQRLRAKAIRAPGDIEQKRLALNEQRRQLRTFLALLRQPLGASGSTAHQLMWRVLGLRQGLPDAAIIAGEAQEVAADSERLTALDLTRRRDLLTQIAVKMNECREVYGDSTGNPWQRARQLSVFDSAAILASAKMAGEHTGRLQQAIVAARAATGYPLPEEPVSCVAAIATMRDVPPPIGCNDATLKAALIDGQAGEALIDQKASWTAAKAALNDVHPDPLSVDRDALDALGAALRALGDRCATVADARSEADIADAGRQTLETLAVDVQALTDRFQLPAASPTVAQVRALVESLAEIGAAEPAVAPMLRSALLADGCVHLLASEQQSAASLAQRRAELGSIVTPDGLASEPEALMLAADTIESANIAQRLFGGDYKRQQRFARRALQGQESRLQDAATLRRTGQLIRDERRFLESSPARAIVSEMAWRGVDTDWSALDTARRSAERVYDLLSSAGLDRLVKDLLDASALELRAPIRQAQALSGAFSSLPAEESGRTLPDAIAKATARCDELQSLVGAIDRVGLESGSPLRIGSQSIVELIVGFQSLDVALRSGVRPACYGWATGPEADLVPLEAALAYVSALAGRPDCLTDILREADAPIALLDKIIRLGDALYPAAAEWSAAIAGFEAQIDTSCAEFAGESARDLTALSEALAAAASDERGLRLAADLNRYLAEADELGCRAAVDLAGGHDVEAGRIADLDELLVCRALLGRYLRADGVALTRLGGLSLEDIRRKFRETDRELQTMDAQRIFSQRLADKAPWGNDYGPKSTWTESALIENEIGKQRRHIPIRDLTKRAGAALQAMKPVWMMSPASVAQYVQPGTVTFDLIVIDEASQMRPEYAASAILRGAQLVVVGDSKQLPPTDFFQSSGDNAAIDDDDVETAVQVDTESILDLANERIGARRQLNWHYRSRHESLIQFSNRQYYENRLVVFPSPNTDEPLLGLKHFHIAGVYEGSINQIEAEAVIRDAVGLMIAYPERSMGIATMNLKQRELIQAEFDRLAGQEPAVRNYIDAFAGGMDAFFIKNLENVQGDERDIILISTVYGPDKDGRVMQRFGPIGSDVGHRRLNVLATRARMSTRLHTSLRSGDVKVVPGSKAGTVALQAYLTYAEGGARFDLAEGGAPDSDFETFVADRLRSAGYEIVHQVGVEGFRIDLGVRHRDYPLGFIAGVECDGATYHSGFTVRDRDKIRQGVLEGLGWKIYRIWSTDWFTNPEQEAAKLLAQLETWRDGALAAFRARTDSGEFEDQGPGASAAARLVVVESRAEAKLVALPDPSVGKAAVKPPAPVMVPAVARDYSCPPEGRKRTLDDIDWYETEQARLYEIWPDEAFAGEVEVVSRATAAPQIYGGAMRVARSQYRGTLAATGETFLEHDIYAAVRRIARMARAVSAA